MTTFAPNALPTRNTTAVRAGATDALARLMSTENITVVRDPASPTATFNTKTRVLTLPVYKTEMSQSLADGLIGHEVGHALYTPSEESTIRGAMNSIDPNNPAVVHDYLNVIEDARIERMMKAKFPGLRRTFVEMYGEMTRDDFFQVADKDIDELPLVDRINLHYKAGINGHMVIPFTAEEEAFIKMIDAARSFDDVVNAARELYDYVTQPKQDQQPEPQSGKGGASGSGNDDGADGDASGDDQQDGDQGSGDANGSKGDKGAGQQDQTATPTMQSENGNGTMEQSGDADDSEKDGAVANGAGIGQNKQNAPASTTNNAMTKKISQQRDLYAKKAAFYRLPTINLDKVIVDVARIHKDIKKQRENMTRQGMTGPKFDAAKHMAKFTENSREYVQTLVREFERKMAADEQRRTFVSRTGSLDMSRVHTYRFNDDLFLKSSWVADGKNHGMVMFIDWSGSMARTLENTMYQMMNLILFCNALRIPFEVYAFTTATPNFDEITYGGSNEDYHTAHAKNCASVCKEYTVTMKEIADYNGRKSSHMMMDTGDYAICTPFSLLNLCSSRLNKKAMRDALENLMFLAKCSNYAPGYMQLGGTPLDECIMAAIPVVNEFRKSSKAQIVNTILLTDGQGGSVPFKGHNYGEPITVRAASGHTYTSDTNQDSSSFLRNIFRAETHSSLTGFYLVERPYIGNLVYDYFSNPKDRKDAEESFNTHKHAVVSDVKRWGYDNYFLLDSTVKSATNKDVVTGSAEESFMRTAANKKSTRAVLSKFTDTIAKDFKF